MKITITADPEIPVPPLLYGGIERIIDSLVHGLVEKGHEITLFAHPDSKVPCTLVPWRGLKSHSIPDCLINSFELSKHIIKQKIDVIHSFSRLAYLTPVLPMNLPKIMSYQREPSTRQISKAVSLARKNSLLFTGCSNYISNKINEVAKAVTVYNCVPIAKYLPKYTVTDNAPLVFLGRIEPVKGPHIAIEVAQKTGKALIIAGNIPLEHKGYFEEKIKPFLTDVIQYIGPVNDSQKNNILGESCALLMPIQWNEPFGIVMAEAMACGTPVLGFCFGSVPEVIQDGINGFICRDTNDMTMKVEQIKSVDRMSVRRIAEEKFSNTIIVAKYIEIYSSMVSTNTKIIKL